MVHESIYGGKGTINKLTSKYIQIVKNIMKRTDYTLSRRK